MLDGALLIDKEAGISSFGAVDRLKKELAKRLGTRPLDLPKIGHGGTLDPFATGLLVVCVGRAVKLARYFLGADKTYTGIIRFGETTEPGDPTAPISETSQTIPESGDAIAEMARKLTLQPYLQTPPMYSAKKRNGKPLYELARQGIEVEREPKLCHLQKFEIFRYELPRAHFHLRCSSGTYVRTLVQDFGRMLGTVSLLESLSRSSSGPFCLESAWSIDRIIESGKPWDELPCWIPFDGLLAGYDRAEATQGEVQALFRGQQRVLLSILQRTEPATGAAAERENCVAIYCLGKLVAVARQETQGPWGIERVFAS